MQRLGREPDPDKMPIDERDFPYEVQLAFFIHSLLPDRWEGMSGSYLGKDWSALIGLLEIYNIDNKPIVTYFLKIIDNLYSRNVNDKMEKRQKASETRIAGQNPGIKING